MERAASTVRRVARQEIWMRRIHAERHAAAAANGDTSTDSTSINPATMADTAAAAHLSRLSNTDTDDPLLVQCSSSSSSSSSFMLSKKEQKKMNEAYNVNANKWVALARTAYTMSSLHCPEMLRWKVWVAGARTEIACGNVSIAGQLLGKISSTNIQV